MAFNIVQKKSFETKMKKSYTYILHSHFSTFFDLFPLKSIIALMIKILFLRRFCLVKIVFNTTLRMDEMFDVLIGFSKIIRTVTSVQGDDNDDDDDEKGNNKERKENRKPKMKKHQGSSGVKSSIPFHSFHSFHSCAM